MSNRDFMPAINEGWAIITNRPYEPEEEVLDKRVLSDATSEQGGKQFIDKDRDVA